MQLNWITVGLIILVVVVGYAGYKLYNKMQALKVCPREVVQEKPVEKPVIQKPVLKKPIEQPKLVPPSMFKQPEPSEEEEEYEEYESETEMFNLNEETEFDYKPDTEMIIPLNINNIIQQVVKKQIDKPSAVIEEIESEKEDLNKKTIIELKEMARKHNIKLNDGRKPKNKETLIKELSNI
jgi:hypothetical protein